MNFVLYRSSDLPNHAHAQNYGNDRGAHSLLIAANYLKNPYQADIAKEPELLVFSMDSGRAQGVYKTYMYAVVEEVIVRHSQRSTCIVDLLRRMAHKVAVKTVSAARTFQTAASCGFDSLPWCACVVWRS